MGTSGAYGGSNSQDWNRARDLLQNLSNEAESGQDDYDRPDNERPISDLWTAIADALNKDDVQLGTEQTIDELPPIQSLLPRIHVPSRPTSAGMGTSGVGGAIISGTSGGAGRKGSRSSRSIVRGASRGGIAIGSAYAVRRGDAASLREIGIELGELRQLSTRMQCAKILDTVLGEGGHPDEYALREAAVEQLKVILLSEEQPGEIETLKGFIASYVFKLSLVELRKGLTSGLISNKDAARKESRIRRYIEARVRMIKFSLPSRVSIREFRDAAARLVKEAIGLLRAGYE